MRMVVQPPGDFIPLDGINYHKTRLISVRPTKNILVVNYPSLETARCVFLSPVDIN